MMTLDYALDRLDEVRRCGNGWVACCPAHPDKHPSLSIKLGDDGRTVLLRCWSRGCPYRDILAAIGGRPPSFLATPVVKTLPALARRDYSGSAVQIWRGSLPALDTLVVTYLRSRAITIPPPRSIRFAPSLKHPTGACLPAMVAAVQRVDGAIVGIHRTFLQADGLGKADVEPNKMTLGACRGGAVRLAEAGPLLAICEGVETGLSVFEANGYPIWVTLGTGGLRTVHLPEVVEEVIVCADGDDAGRSAACDGAQRFLREGRRVRIAHAPEGQDFNDVLSA